MIDSFWERVWKTLINLLVLWKNLLEEVSNNNNFSIIIFENYMHKWKKKLFIYMFIKIINLIIYYLYIIIKYSISYLIKILT